MKLNPNIYSNILSKIMTLLEYGDCGESLGQISNFEIEMNLKEKKLNFFVSVPIITLRINFQGVNKFISNMRCNRYISNEIKT